MTNSYDEKKYESHSYTLTNPAHLQAIGKLFGLESAPYQKARVLELGCASGGNIIPLATLFPKSRYVGLDLSALQIEDGNKIVDELELKNIQLKHQSILDFEKNEGEFDYILCHGVYSWVPLEVRSKILDICKKHLAPKGIGCISYNTLPCWNMVLCVRDMMQFHTRNYKTAEEKVLHSRQLLNFLVKGLEKEETPYAKFLKSEIQIVSNSDDYYIFHEYLEDVNFPIYFHEFAKQLNDNNLVYLADSNLSSMFVGNMKSAFSQKLNEIKDIVRMGQYMDFIRNQRFRTTLFCHQQNSVNRQLQVQDVEKFCLAYSAKIQPIIALEKILSNETITFEGQGLILTLQKPLLKAFMKILHDRYGKPIQFKQLIALTMNMVSATDKQESIKQINQELNVMRLVLGGILTLHLDEGEYTDAVSARPKTPRFIQIISKLRDKVPNIRHETIKLLPVERIILQFLDGKNSVQDITKILTKKIRSKELQLSDEKGVIIDKPDDLPEKVQSITTSALQNLARKAYLIS